MPAADAWRSDTPAVAANDGDNNDNAVAMMMLGGVLCSNLEAEEDNEEKVDGAIVVVVASASDCIQGRGYALNAKHSSFSQDDKEDDDDDKEDVEDDDVEEDNVSFLRRASLVHDALLLSLSLHLSITDGRELACAFVESVLLLVGGGTGSCLQRAVDGGMITMSSLPTSIEELVSLLSSLVFVNPSSSSSDCCPSHIHLSCLLLVVQFLLHLDEIVVQWGRRKVVNPPPDTIFASSGSVVVQGGGVTVTTM
jgi:hypothetical protein